MQTTDHQNDEAVKHAALWLASERDHTGRAVIPELKTRFGITAMQAIEAIRFARRMREGRGAHAVG